MILYATSSIFLRHLDTGISDLAVQFTTFTAMVRPVLIYFSLIVTGAIISVYTMAPLFDLVDYFVLHSGKVRITGKCFRFPVPGYVLSFSAYFVLGYTYLRQTFNHKKLSIVLMSLVTFIPFIAALSLITVEMKIKEASALPVMINCSNFPSGLIVVLSLLLTAFPIIYSLLQALIQRQRDRIKVLKNG